MGVAWYVVSTLHWWSCHIPDSQKKDNDQSKIVSTDKKYISCAKRMLPFGLPCRFQTMQEVAKPSIPSPKQQTTEHRHLPDKRVIYY